MFIVNNIYLRMMKVLILKKEDWMKPETGMTGRGSSQDNGYGAGFGYGTDHGYVYRDGKNGSCYGHGYADGFAGNGIGYGGGNGS